MPSSRKARRYGQRDRARHAFRQLALDRQRACCWGRRAGLYVEQTLRFRRPVFIGDTLTARSELVEIDAEKRRLHCATAVQNQHGKIVVDGAAVLQKD